MTTPTAGPSLSIQSVHSRQQHKDLDGPRPSVTTGVTANSAVLNGTDVRDDLAALLSWAGFHECFIHCLFTTVVWVATQDVEELS